MGHRNPDRVALSVRRARCETVSQMLAQRWEVITVCGSCKVQLRVDLRTIAAIRGTGFSLWNRDSRCKKFGCRGTVEFHAKAPGMAWFERSATLNPPP
jgi:hypothetical protein